MMATSPPAISSTEFGAFQALFYERTGIVFGDAKRYFVDRRVEERIARSGAGSMDAYMRSLRHLPAQSGEWESLVNALTVNETYFDREDYQFRCLVASILPEIVAPRVGRVARPIRIWSLPCSTGEEPYSLAIRLLEDWAEVDAHDVEITASDIDTNVLERARAGLYEARAVQNLSDAVKRRYFTRTAGGAWQLVDALRHSVRFVPVNLIDRGQMRPFRGMFDVIFCRNLLIYFDDRSRARAAEELYEALAPGGFICLGHSESMTRMSSLFTIRKFPDAIVYQKPRA